MDEYYRNKLREAYEEDVKDCLKGDPNLYKMERSASVVNEYFLMVEHEKRFVKANAALIEKWSKEKKFYEEVKAKISKSIEEGKAKSEAYYANDPEYQEAMRKVWSIVDQLDEGESNV